LAEGCFAVTFGAERYRERKRTRLEKVRVSFDPERKKK
jgi:hypothetical protein